MDSSNDSDLDIENEMIQKNGHKDIESREKNLVTITKKKENTFDENFEEIDQYPLNEPYAFVRILKDNETLDKYYWVEEPIMKEDENNLLDYFQKKIIEKIDIRLDELETQSDIIEDYLIKNVNKIISEYEIKIDDKLKEKIIYYIKRRFIGYDRIDPLMRDPNIEDISCDGSNVPIFLFHRRFGSLESNIKFKDENELSDFVVKLAQKCGKHISIANPMLDATLPDNSRIQMTLSVEVTTKGSTFTIRKFRSDPFTPTDLIKYNSMSSELIAFMWLAVEHGFNALFAGGTASGKTSALNALALFIPHESKIVSIEETREINLPHSNWIPGITRLGFGERINDRLIGEIDLFDLMKAALRQRPEYILVGEIRGKEAYVLFQAMATGHTTYSTVHADSAKSLIHRLEGKPIEIPRVMLQSLDIILLQSNVQIKDSNVRRCKQIVEVIDIDSFTQEVLTNEVFHWDSLEDKFVYSGKSYIMENIRKKLGISKEEMKKEILKRIEILEWMNKNNIRAFKRFAEIITYYSEKPDELIDKIRDNSLKINQKEDNNIDDKKLYFESEYKVIDNNDKNIIPENKKKISLFFFKKKLTRKNKKRGRIDDDTK